MIHLKKYIYALMLVGALLLTGCADAGKDQSVNAGEVVTLDGSTSRASFKFVIEQYTWKQIIGEPVTLSDIHAVNPTFVAPSTEEPILLVFRLTTKERFAGRWVKSFKDTVNIAVKATTLPPVDTTPPVLTLKGQAEVVITQGDDYVDAGASAVDDTDGDITSRIKVDGAVDSTKVGTYTLSYTVSDTAGNAAKAVSRKVIVEVKPDTTPPVITLTGESNITLFKDANYTELGATALDDRDGNVSVVTTGTVDTATVGSYAITYSATDKAGNSASLERTVHVVLPPDTIPPVITLNGESNITLEQNAVYTELGATAVDGVDGNVSVTTTGTVDTSTIGNYTVTYSATDSAGNEANTTRTITVIDVTPPILTLNGESNITLEQNVIYTELGATAVDGVDGNVSVTTTGTVDTSTIGNYTITYSAQDSAGNEANITRSVEVINSTPTLSSINLESNATTVNVGDMVQLSVVGTYSDGSSNAVDENITYTITPNDSAEMNGSVLIAKKDGNVTVQATVGGVNSNTLNLAITWVVNGHVLPPEPDPAVNNATLLGVDVNDNGVRDDVERVIYKKFPKEIRRKQLMQRAKSDQSMMADDEAIKNAQKWQKIIANKNIACAKYLFRKFDIDFNLEADDYMDNIQYNTKDRVFKYMRYNHALGGGVYFTPESIVNESSCEFNVTQALKAQ